jgi:FtsH-binding integral membrane protein
MELHQTHFGAAGELTQERATFIQKVYGLLSLSLLSALVGTVLGAQVPIGYHLPLAIVGFLSLIAALVFRKVRGVNLALLFGFTFINGLASGPVLAAVAGAGYGHLIVKALLMTFTTFGALTVYVFWSRTDFSYLGGFLFTALIGACVVGLISIFFPMGHLMNSIYCYFGILLFIGYILYDTSNLIHNTPADEYVSATLSLYLDIINLFWYILRLFMNKSDD